MPIPNGYVSGQVIQAVPTGINSAFVFLTGASFSAVSSVSAPTSTFTTSYKNFKVILQITAVSTLTSVQLRFRASGTDDANNIYRQTSAQITSGGGSTGQLGDRTTFGVADVTNLAGGFGYASFDINDMASATVIKSVNGLTSFNNGTNHIGGNFVGQLSTGKAFDSITFLTSTGTMTGNYRIYGYTES